MKRKSKSKTVVIPHQHQLTKEVSLVLITKLILIFLLWAFFFSNPLSKHINDARFTDHLFNSTLQLKTAFLPLSITILISR